MGLKTIILQKTVYVAVVFMLFFRILCAAEANENTLQKIEGGGVIITFDDRYVSDWSEVDRVLSKYSWKATFFITQFQRLNKKDIQILHDLQSKGHEIGSHGYRHISAYDYMSDHSVSEYVDDEVLPSLDAMREEGFIINAFAYPFGSRDTSVRFLPRVVQKINVLLFGEKINSLDKVLLRHVAVLRGTTYGKTCVSKQKNYANGSRLVFGLGIDKSYGHDIEYLLDILEYAKKYNKIAVFYAHRVSSSDTPSEYTTTYKTLDKICDYVVNNNMHFMTMKDLVVK